MYSKKGFFLDKPDFFASCFQSPSAIINVFFQAMPRPRQVGSMATAWTGESASSASVMENSAKLSRIKSGTGIAQMIRLPKTVFDAKLYHL